MNNSKKIFTLTLLLITFFTSYTNSEIIHLESCEQTIVQTAIDSAQEGDVIILPADTVVWKERIRDNDYIKAAISWRTKELSIIGAGIDKTMIIDSTRSVWGTTAFWIMTDHNATNGFRISGITFKTDRTGQQYGPVTMTGSWKNWRIDNCKFENYTNGHGICGIDSYTYGVIDKCIFKTNINGTFQGIDFTWDNDPAWERPLTLGTDIAIYIEDCMFDYVYRNNGIFDGASGVRYVVRNSEIINTLSQHHGRDSGHPHRSAHSFEFYRNTFTSDKNIYAAVYFRGGTGVVFDNVMNGDFGFVISVSNFCSCGQGNCEWDRCYDYPCIDQIGRTTDMNGDSIQDLFPFYEWNNTYNGNDVDVTIRNMPDCDSPSVYDHIQLGRDYIEDVPLDTSIYKPFVYPHPLRLISPKLLSPENNSQQNSNNIILTWNKSESCNNIENIRYNIQISHDSLFNNFITEINGYIDTSYSIILSENTFFWRIKTVVFDNYINEFSESKWSKTNTFDVTIDNNLNQPQLISPNNNDSLFVENIEFKWYKVNNADYYNLEISESNNFDTVILSSGIIDTFFSDTNFILPGKQYFWQIQAIKNDTIQSAWSDTFSFYTNCQQKIYIIVRNDLNENYKIIQGVNSLVKFYRDNSNLLTNWNDNFEFLYLKNGIELNELLLKIVNSNNYSSYYDTNMQSTIPTAICIFENGNGQTTNLIFDND